MAERLREERQRVEPHQGRFAQRIGLTQQKQSFLENANREIRTEYLAAIGEAGLDVLYILTGRRQESPLLSRKATELLNAFGRLTPDIQDAAVTVVRAMNEGAGARPSESVRMTESQRPYLVEDSG